MAWMVRHIAILSAAVGLVLAPRPAVAGGCGPVVSEQLTGPTLNAVVPDGRAIADESRFMCGGTTLLTVQVSNVNLPDGTVLDVSLDFMPVGTITLSRMAGVVTRDLGHFALSNDEVRVTYQGNFVLIGAFFR